jgi:hypothetical protein
MESAHTLLSISRAPQARLRSRSITAAKLWANMGTAPEEYMALANRWDVPHPRRSLSRKHRRLLL